MIDDFDVEGFLKEFVPQPSKWRKWAFGIRYYTLVLTMSLRIEGNSLILRQAIDGHYTNDQECLPKTWLLDDPEVSPEFIRNFIADIMGLEKC